MPDPLRLGAALAVAAVLAALGVAICRRLATRRNSHALAAGLVLGPAGGFYAGCEILGHGPHWRLAEDQDRLLAIVVPAIVVTELVALVPGVPRKLAWALRFAVAFGAARVLLAGTVYLSHAAGPDSRVWSGAEVWLALGGLGLALAAGWWALVRLGDRAPDVSLPALLALDIAGSGVTIMLSGYTSAGLLALPFAAALGGGALAARSMTARLPLAALLGVSAVLLFSLLVLGRFFGNLTTTQATLLWCAPGCGWLAELGALRNLRPAVRGLLRAVLVGVVIAAVVLAAARKFAAAHAAASGAAEAGDYLNFGS